MRYAMPTSCTECFLAKECNSGMYAGGCGFHAPEENTNLFKKIVKASWRAMRYSAKLEMSAK